MAENPSGYDAPSRPESEPMKSPPLRLERPQLLTDMVLARLRQAIVDGQLALGEQVSEAQLAQQMGVSKTPVREALARLSRDGLVQIHPQRGTFVFSLAPREVEEICRFREVLEVTALELAMQHDRAALVAELDDNVARMGRAQKARDWRGISHLDHAFHQAIVDRCDNGYVKQAYQSIASKIGALRARLPAENERVGHCRDNHAAIVRLVRDADTRKAGAALAAHIRDTLSSYRAASELGVSAGEAAAQAAAPRRRAVRSARAA